MFPWLLWSFTPFVKCCHIANYDIPYTGLRAWESAAMAFAIITWVSLKIKVILWYGGKGTECNIPSWATLMSCRRPLRCTTSLDPECTHSLKVESHSWNRLTFRMFWCFFLIKQDQSNAWQNAALFWRNCRRCQAMWQVLICIVLHVCLTPFMMLNITYCIA